MPVEYQRPRRVKQPDEVRVLTFDFTEKLTAGASLTGSPTIVAGAGLSASSGTISADGTRVSVYVAGGSLNSNYVLTVRCAASDGQTLELDARIDVRDEN